jgi:hypothetical protein
MRNITLKIDGEKPVFPRAAAAFPAKTTNFRVVFRAA